MTCWRSSAPAPQARPVRHCSPRWPAARRCPAARRGSPRPPDATGVGECRRAWASYCDRRAGPARRSCSTCFRTAWSAVIARERLETGVQRPHLVGGPRGGRTRQHGRPDLGRRDVVGRHRQPRRGLRPAAGGHGVVVVVERDAGAPTSANCRALDAPAAAVPDRPRAGLRPPTATGRDRSARALHAGGARARPAGRPRSSRSSPMQSPSPTPPSAQRHQRRYRRRGYRGTGLQRSRRAARSISMRSEPAGRSVPPSNVAAGRSGTPIWSTLVTGRARSSTAAALPGAGRRARRFQRQRTDLPLCRPVVLQPRAGPRLRRRPRARRLTDRGCSTYARGYREGPIRTLMAYAPAGSPTADAELLERGGSRARRHGLPTGNSLQDNARQARRDRRQRRRVSRPTASQLGAGRPRQFAATVQGGA